MAGTPTPTSTSKAKAAEERGAATSYNPVDFPNTHTEGGFGTKQAEPKPEDYPADLRMASPLEQVNPNANKTSVGTAGELEIEAADAAVNKAQAEFAKNAKALKSDLDEKAESDAD